MSTVECQSCPTWMDADEAIWIGDKTYCDGCEPKEICCICGDDYTGLDCLLAGACPDCHDNADSLEELIDAAMEKNCA